MSVTDLGLLGSNSNKVAGTTIAITNTTGATIPAGTLIHICYTCDNIASTTAPTLTAPSVGGVTATANHATPVGSGVTTTAGSGIWHQCWRVVTTSSIANGATIASIVSNQSAVTKAAHAEGWSGMTATLRGTVVSATSTSGSASAASGGTAPATGDLVIGSISSENNALATGDADTLNGTWDTLIGVATTGGSAATNCTTGTQDKIVTAGGAQTYNPTGGVADTVVCIYALQPAPIAGDAALTQDSTLTSTATSFNPKNPGVVGNGSASTGATANPAAGNLNITLPSGFGGSSTVARAPQVDDTVYMFALTSGASSTAIPTPVGSGWTEIPNDPNTDMGGAAGSAYFRGWYKELDSTDISNNFVAFTTAGVARKFGIIWVTERSRIYTSGSVSPSGSGQTGATLPSLTPIDGGLRISILGATNSVSTGGFFGFSSSGDNVVQQSGSTSSTTTANAGMGLFKENAVGTTATGTELLNATPFSSGTAAVRGWTGILMPGKQADGAATLAQSSSLTATGKALSIPYGSGVIPAQWYKMDELGLSNGANIATIPNKGSADMDLTGLTGSLPQYVTSGFGTNNRPYAFFNSRIAYSPNPSPVSDEYTIVFVVRDVNTFGAGADRHFFGTGNAIHIALVGTSATQAWAIAMIDAGVYAQDGAGDSSEHIVVLRRNGFSGVQRFSVDGVSKTITNDSVPVSAAQAANGFGFVLGGRANSFSLPNPGVFDTGEFLLWD